MIMMVSFVVIMIILIIINDYKSLISVLSQYKPEFPPAFFKSVNLVIRLALIDQQSKESDAI